MRIMCRLTFCIVIFLGVSSLLIIADDPCRFEDSSKRVIDLSSVGRTDGTAAFPDVLPSGFNYMYSYNPCKPFTEGTECVNVAVCQVSKDRALRFTLGTQESAKWDAGAGPGSNPVISYAAGEKKVTLTLICSESTTGDFEFEREFPTNTYKLSLSHKCACWDGCKNSPGPDTTPGPPKPGNGIGAGAIFIIILVAFSLVYFAVFAAYYRFRLKLSGKDLVAHRTFWVALPTYAKDGTVYIFRRATGKGGLEYRQI